MYEKLKINNKIQWEQKIITIIKSYLQTFFILTENLKINLI